MHISVYIHIQVACRYCGKRLLPRTLKHHLHYFCGPGAQRTARLGLRDKKRAAPVIRSELVLGKGAAALVAGARGVQDSEVQGDQGGGEGTKRRGVGQVGGGVVGGEGGRGPPTPFNIFREYVDEQRTQGETAGGTGGSREGDAAMEDIARVDDAAMGAREMYGGLADTQGGGREEGGGWGENGGKGEQGAGKDGDDAADEAEVDEGEQGAGMDGDDGVDEAAAIQRHLESVSTLHGVEWHRVILDEAHRIKVYISVCMHTHRYTDIKIYLYRHRHRRGAPHQRIHICMYAYIQIYRYKDMFE